jgi:CheY-like chemotaxis protein
VVVVDDEPTAREVMTQALQRHGARVTSAASAADAMEILNQCTVDVVLADIAMPGEDGYSFIRRIRASKNPRLAAIPAAAVTAHARHADRELALAAGFQRHLAKPVDPIALARTVEQLLDRGAEAA